MVAEFAESPFEKEAETQHIDGKLVNTITLEEPLFWKVYVDSAANQKASKVGLVLASLEKTPLKSH